MASLGETRAGVTRSGAGAPGIRRWRWPVSLAVLTVFGLLSALLGQGGIWWALSWVALATPLVVIGYCPARRSTRPLEPRRAPSARESRGSAGVPQRRVSVQLGYS